MKVQELRTLMKTAKREDVETALVECYKKVPKAKKEGEIDELVGYILRGEKTTGRKTAAKKGQKTDMVELKVEIADFLDDAYAQNFLIPNARIPRRERPKWRFAVQRYIRQLQKVPAEDPEYGSAVEMLGKLYDMLCYACDYYLFSTEDPFRSIQWEQNALFALLVKKTFVAGYAREDISSLLVRASTGGLSRESVYEDQIVVLVNEMKTTDLKYMAIEEADRLVTEAENGGLHNASDYERREKIKALCQAILILRTRLSEMDEGLQYFFAHDRNGLGGGGRNSREVSLYVVLRTIQWQFQDRHDLWIHAYEYGLHRGIKPRNELKERYREYRKESPAGGQ